MTNRPTIETSQIQKPCDLLQKKKFHSIPITSLYNLTADLIINKQTFSNNS